MSCDKDGSVKKDKGNGNGGGEKKRSKRNIHC